MVAHGRTTQYNLGRATQHNLSSKHMASQDEVPEARALHEDDGAPHRETGAPPWETIAAGARPQGRRHIFDETNMSHAGMSNAQALRLGRGRRNFPEETGRRAELGNLEHHRSRKGFAETDEDQVRDEVFQSSRAAWTPSEAGSCASCADDMKDQIRQTMAQDYGMVVVDAERWDGATITQNGCTWKLETLTEQGLGVCREGRSAKLIAEKLSLCGGQELKYFGLRYVGEGKAVVSPSRSTRATPIENKNNPKQASPGVHAALGCGDVGLRSSPQLSCARKDPQDKMRRYIGAGGDHFSSSVVASHGDLGANRDMSFCEGIERGIGHGRRQVGTAPQGHLFGTTLTK